jgi:hypothetical protein
MALDVNTDAEEPAQSTLTLIFDDKDVEAEYLQAHDTSMRSPSRIFCAPAYTIISLLIMFLSVVVPAHDKNFVMTLYCAVAPLSAMGIVLERKYNGRGFTTFLRVLQGYMTFFFIWIGFSPLMTIHLGRCFLGEEVGNDVIMPVNCPMIRAGLAPVANVMATCIMPLVLTTLFGMQVIPAETPTDCSLTD